MENTEDTQPFRTNLKHEAQAAVDRLNKGTFCLRQKKHVPPESPYYINELRLDIQGQAPIFSYVVMQKDKLY